MSQSFKDWHSKASNLKRIGFWSGAIFMGLMVVSPVLPASNSVKTVPIQEQKNPVTPARTEVIKQVVTVRRIVVETVEVPYTKSEVSDGNIAQGASEVRTAGVNGIKTMTYEIVTKDGVEAEKSLVSDELTTPPVTEVTAIGTKVPVQAVAPQRAVSSAVAGTSSNCDPNYSPCIQNTSGNALNCPDIGVQVRVVGVDHNRFDADGDGWGCESYK